jgi:hypothetical protein
MPLVRDRYVTTETDDRRHIENQALRPHEPAAGSDQLDLLREQKTDTSADAHYGKGFKSCVENEDPGHDETLLLALPLILGFTPAEPGDDVVRVRGMRGIAILGQPTEPQQRWVWQREERPLRPPSVWSETAGHHERRRP